MSPWTLIAYSAVLANLLGILLAYKDGHAQYILLGVFAAALNVTILLGLAWRDVRIARALSCKS